MTLCLDDAASFLGITGAGRHQLLYGRLVLGRVEFNVNGINGINGILEILKMSLLCLVKYLGQFNVTSYILHNAGSAQCTCNRE